MKFLFASDSFKGTLSSEEIIGLLDDAAQKVFPGCETKGVPVADGGEGTVDAVVAATGGSLRTISVHGPLMEKAEALLWSVSLGFGSHRDGGGFWSADGAGAVEKSAQHDDVGDR